MSQSDVQHLIATVAESFGTSIDEWLECFADPFVLAAPVSTVVLEHEAARGMFEQVRSQLRDRGFDRSALRSVDIMMLGDDMAFADASFERLRSDGSVLEPVQAGYLCRRRNDRWLVVTLAPRTAAIAPSADE